MGEPGEAAEAAELPVVEAWRAFSSDGPNDPWPALVLPLPLLLLLPKEPWPEDRWLFSSRGGGGGGGGTPTLLLEAAPGGSPRLLFRLADPGTDRRRAFISFLRSGRIW